MLRAVMLPGMAAPEYEWESPAKKRAEAAPVGHLVTTRATRILSVDEVAAVLLQRPAHVLEQEPLAALVGLETRAAFHDRLLALSDDDVIDEWKLSLQGPRDASIDVVATVRPMVGDAGHGQLQWDIAADPRESDALWDVGSRTDMARELRQLAHELNQPLAAIVTYARGSQMRLDGNTLSDADLRTALEVIVKEAMRATEIVRALDRRWGKP